MQFIQKYVKPTRPGEPIFGREFRELTSPKWHLTHQLLMQEILHHLGYIKPHKQWDEHLVNWCRISAINSRALNRLDIIPQFNYMNQDLNVSHFIIIPVIFTLRFWCPRHHNHHSRLFLSRTFWASRPPDVVPQKKSVREKLVESSGKRQGIQ